MALFSDCGISCSELGKYDFVMEKLTVSLTLSMADEDDELSSSTKPVSQAVHLTIYRVWWVERRIITLGFPIMA